MKQTMTLEQYLKMGGDIAKLDITTVKQVYNCSLPIKKIISIGAAGLNRTGSSVVYAINYQDGSRETYSSNWIRVEVQVMLDPSYIE